MSVEVNGAERVVVELVVALLLEVLQVGFNLRGLGIVLWRGGVLNGLRFVGAFFGSGSLKVRFPNPDEKVLCCLCERHTVFSKVGSLGRWEVVLGSMLGP